MTNSRHTESDYRLCAGVKDCGAEKWLSEIWNLDVFREAGRYHPGPMHLKTATLLKLNGYHETANAPAMVLAAAERMARRAQLLFKPIVRFQAVSLDRLADGRLVLDGVVVRPGVGAGKVLSKSVAAIVVVVTMGPRFDEETGRFSTRGDMIEALFLESAGWLGIEAATKSFKRWIRERVTEDGYTLTRRLAPGYGTWPLTDQRALFAAFGQDDLPVRLLDSCAMSPKMSRSGVFGLIPTVRS